MKYAANDTFDSYCPKRVSYILATRNHADKLDEALKRCREFIKPEDELIIMDGVSIDHTKEVVNKYSDIVTAFISEPDKHPIYASRDWEGGPIKDPINALNKGILLARGKYIKFLADDDVYYPEAVGKAIQVLENNDKIDLLICGGRRERFGRIEYVYIPPGTGYGKSAKDAFKYSRCGIGQFYRRKSLAKVGLHPPTVFDENCNVTHPDIEHVLRFISGGLEVKFCRINLFYAPWSHFGEYSSDAGKFVTFSTQKYWQDAAKRYTSPSFYLSYVFKNKIRKTPLFQRLYFLCKIIRRKIKNPVLKRLLGKKTSSCEIIWDDGFS